MRSNIDADLMERSRGDCFMPALQQGPPSPKSVLPEDPTAAAAVLAALTTPRQANVIGRKYKREHKRSHVSSTSYISATPENTPYGLDVTLLGRPIIDASVSVAACRLLAVALMAVGLPWHGLVVANRSTATAPVRSAPLPAAAEAARLRLQGQPSQRDVLRLRRLVQHLALLITAQEPGADWPADEQTHSGLHSQVLAVCEAIFHELCQWVSPPES